MSQFIGPHHQSDASKQVRHRVITYIEQESGSGGKESADATIRNLSKHGFAIKADRPTGNKDLRLEPFAGQAETGNVFIVPGFWNEEYVDEMCAIPYAAVRDPGDASSDAFNILTSGSSGNCFKGIGFDRTPADKANWTKIRDQQILLKHPDNL